MSTAETGQREEMLENTKMGLRRYLTHKVDLREMESLASWLKPETKIDTAILDIWNKFSFLIKEAALISKLKESERAEYASNLLHHCLRFSDEARQLLEENKSNLNALFVQDLNSQNPFPLVQSLVESRDYSDSAMQEFSEAMHNIAQSIK